MGELRVTSDNGITSSAPLFAAELVEGAGIIRQGFHFLGTRVLAFGWLIHRHSQPGRVIA